MDPRCQQLLLASAAALLLLAASCARSEPERIRQADLLELFPLTQAARERGTIDLGTPDGDALLRGGWAPGEMLDETSVAWAIERKAKLRFAIREVAPRRLRLRARHPASTATAGERRTGTPVLLELNGRRLGMIRVHDAAATFEVKLPVGAQLAGDNLLELEHPTIAAPRVAGDTAARPRNAVAYDVIEIVRDDGSDPAPARLVERAGASAGGGRALLIPSGTEVDYFVRRAEAAELRLTYRLADARDTATLRVLQQGDAGGEPASTVLPAQDDARSATIALAVARGEIARVTLRVAGAGSVRIEQAATYAAPAAVPAALAPATAASGGGVPRPNILLYVIDTLRADHLGCYGYGPPTSPRIDALAREGLTFTRMIAQAPWTRPSVASMLTGLEPLAHGANTLRHKLRPDVATLAELLREHGYETAAFVTNANVAGRLGFQRGFDTWVDLPEDHARPSLHVQSDELNVAVLDWLGKRGDRPFFLYVHASDPHSPYTPDPELLARFRDGGDATPPPDVKGLRAERLAPADGAAPAADPTVFPADRLAALTAAYDAEIAHNDASVGALLDELRRSEAGRNTIVVLTSDHGEELGDHGDLEHGHSLHEELLHVPLIVRLPDGRFAGERRAMLAQHVDLLPTLLDATGARVPDGLPGRSLLVASDQVDPAREVHSHTDFGPFELMSLTTPRWKAVEVVDGPRGRHGVAVYDLDADPHERRDVAAQRAALAGYARQELGATRRAAATGAGGEAPLIDPETAARLRALGYAD